MTRAVKGRLTSDWSGRRSSIGAKANLRVAAAQSERWAPPDDTSLFHREVPMTRLLLGICATLVGMSTLGCVIAAEWPTARLGPKQVWDDAYDQATQSRFIPMQLIVPGAWDGIRKISLPTASEADGEGTVWTGPQEWRNPYTGQMLTVYDRRRTNRREGSVEQKMGVRADGSAIGRVYDSRFGGGSCDQEAKFPLGVWKQGEVRTFEYVCLTTRGGQVVERRRTARITIEELDYEYGGVPHSLRFAWRYSDVDSGEVLDHRTYIFSPGRGLAAQYRR